MAANFILYFYALLKPCPSYAFCNNRYLSFANRYLSFINRYLSFTNCDTSRNNGACAQAMGDQLKYSEWTISADTDRNDPNLGLTV